MSETAIEIRKESIPAKPEDLKKFILIGRQVVEAHKAKLKAISQIEMAATAHQAALEDGQTVAEVVLDAETKLGEMLAAIDKKNSRLHGADRGSQRGTTVKTLPAGINKKMSHEAQQIYKHPDVVDKCKKKCREKGELVTSQCVLREVRKANGEAKSQGSKKPGPKPKGYYLTASRLSFLRDKIKHILGLLDVAVITLCPITLVVAELHSVQKELIKLEPQRKRENQMKKGPKNVT